MGAKPHGSVWPVVPLGQIARKVTRKNTGGLTRVLTASGKQGLVDQREYFSRSVAGADLSNYYHLRKGEFAYNRSEMDGYPYGAIKRLERYSDGIVSILYICFSLFDPDCDHDFYTHLFDSGLLNPQFRSIAKVGGRAHGLLNVSDSDFYAIQVPKPPIDLQRRVTRTLNAVDEAIAATRAVIEQTRRLKSALLQELLTKGLPGEKHRFKSDRHFGTFPISWSTKKLSQVVPDNRPITYGIVQAGPDIPGGVPYIRVSDMQGRQLETCGMLRTSPEIANNYRRSRVHPGDVVFALRGDVGAVHIVPQELEGANLTQGTARISPGPLVDGRFLLWALRSPSCVDAIHKRIKGSTFKEISLTDLADVPIAVPSLNEQQRIRDVLDAVEHRIWSDEDHCDELLQLKSALSQGLLMGRIPVKGGR